MKITEQRLRNIIRSIILESSDFELDKDHDGKGLLPSLKDEDVGVSITKQESDKIKRKYRNDISDASSEDAKDLAGNIKKYSRAKNISVLDPNDGRAINSAFRNNPEALLPLFVIPSSAEGSGYIIFKTVGSHKYYIRSLSQYGLQRSSVERIIEPFNHDFNYNI